jgi:hypothetical protein
VTKPNLRIRSARITATAWTSAAVLLGAGLVAMFAPDATASASPKVFTFGESSTPQSWVVPAGVKSATFDVVAAIGQGGACDRTAGYGGETKATIPVTPGETLQINVGDSYYGEVASGNSSDVRRGAFKLGDRLIVAGGGGYSADLSGTDSSGNCTGLRGGPGQGGDGGAPAGYAGNGEVGCTYPGGNGGGGGTHAAGGAGGAICGPGGAGSPGVFGTGGAPGGPGSAPSPCSVGGRGGDGWYGGGGGGTTDGPIGSPGGCTDASGTPIANPPLGGGGGGGSSYVEPAGTGVVFKPGVNGNYFGSVTITTGTAPKVTSVSPGSGSTSGGRKVTILGKHFKGATAVRFGTKAAKHVVVVSGTKITARSPAHGAGVVDVRVKTPGGRSAKVKADHFTYK